jgi:hypothetical protein
LRAKHLHDDSTRSPIFPPNTLVQKINEEDDSKNPPTVTTIFKERAPATIAYAKALKGS